ncbi:MAG: fumarylacetoacetate hydrolase family protein, partial [Terracidiphilus sp.]
MKYCRFLFEGKTHYGKVETRAGEFWIVDLAPVPEEDLAFHLARFRAEAAGEVVTDLAAFDFEPMPLSAAQLLAPVTPSKILCVGRNYREHARELGNEVPAEPLIFSKPPSSLLAPGGVVRMPAASERVDFEGELAMVIGRRLSRFKAGG